MSYQAVLAATDVSLVHLRKSPVFEKVIPSKMFEAMGLEKPIILGVQGESAGILNAGKAGIPVIPEDTDSHVEAILKLYHDKDLAVEMGKKGRKHVVEHFDRRQLSLKYLELLTEFHETSTAS